MKHPYFVIVLFLSFSIAGSPFAHAQKGDQVPSSPTPNAQPTLSKFIEKAWQSNPQIEQALDSKITALELRQRTWHAWFEWLAASGSAIEWITELGAET